MAGPYVLVGHSYGGLIVRLYASRYPKDVSGLVLVDALSEGLRDAETPEQWATQRILMEGDLRESLALYPDLERIDPDRSFDQIRAAQAQEVNVGVQRAQFEHAIALLVGKPPAELSLARAQLPERVPVVPTDVPSTLLERRPDIAEVCNYRSSQSRWHCSANRAWMVGGERWRLRF